MWLVMMRLISLINLLFTNTQVLRLRRAFANGSSANIKFSVTVKDGKVRESYSRHTYFWQFFIGCS